MSEFLHFVWWELRRYSVMAILACFTVLLIFAVMHRLYRRKYGVEKTFPWRKLLLPFVFGCYLLVVFFLTNMRASGIYRTVNLHLFRAWMEAWNNFSVKNWANVLLNIAMFVPMGFLLPLMGRPFRRWYVTIPVGALFSAVIELFQLAFIRGVCDVDDLFCNTLGCAVGYFAVMFLLSGFGEKGRRWKSALVNGCLFLLLVGSVGSVFAGYRFREFGNLPDAAAYTINTKGTEWVLACSLPEMGDTAPVYQIQTRTNEDCDAFAEEFRQIIPTVFDDISYYQEAAYYMDHGNGDGAHFLYVNYLDQGFTYIAVYEEDRVWGEYSREAMEKLLEKYMVQIPEQAEFYLEEDGWHVFRAEQVRDGELLYDGDLRVRADESGIIWDIENDLLSYGYYRDAAILRPDEAYSQLCAGKFQDVDFFETKKPDQIRVVDCTVEYRVDTKGFYQPVYVFTVISFDGDYQGRLLIPALR